MEPIIECCLLVCTFKSRYYIANALVIVYYLARLTRPVWQHASIVSYAPTVALASFLSSHYLQPSPVLIRRNPSISIQKSEGEVITVKPKISMSHISAQFLSLPASSIPIFVPRPFSIDAFPSSNTLITGRLPSPVRIGSH